MAHLKRYGQNFNVNIEKITKLQKNWPPSPPWSHTSYLSFFLHLDTFGLNFMEHAFFTNDCHNVDLFIGRWLGGRSMPSTWLGNYPAISLILKLWQDRRIRQKPISTRPGTTRRPTTCSSPCLASSSSSSTLAGSTLLRPWSTHSARTTRTLTSTTWSTGTFNFPQSNQSSLFLRKKFKASYHAIAQVHYFILLIIVRWKL